MAINSQKLLPGSSSGSIVKYAGKQFEIVSSNTKVSRKSPIQKKKEDSFLKDLIVIKSKVISIDKLLKTSSLLTKKSLDLKNKNERVKKSLKREKKLEEKPKGKGGLKLPSVSLPATGFLDSIKRFLFWTILGRLFFTYFNGENLKKLTGVLQVIGKVGDFVEGTLSTVLNSLVNFIDFSYTKYDEVRGLVKKVGGKKGTEIFDKFSKSLNTFINSAIIIGILLSKGKKIPGLPGRRGGTPRGGKPRGGTPKGGTTKPNVNLRNYLGRDAQAKLIERRYGNNAARIYENARANGKTAQQARAAVQKAIQSGRIVAQEAGEGLAQRGGSSLLKGGLKNAPGRLGVRLLGKGGVKGAIKGISKGFGRIPLIGPIVDFLVSVFVFREKPGRAAAGAVGNAVGTAIGGFLGTFIPFPGVGTWLGATGGGILGDILGRSLYDATIGADKSKQKEETIQTRAAGGPVTRGGRYESSGTRTLISQKTKKRPPKVLPEKTMPGKSVGGLKQIQKLYPNPSDPKKPNALQALKKTSETLKKTKVVGAIMGASIDIALGQKPNKAVYDTIGNNISYLVAESADRQAAMSMSNLTRAIAAMADGGTVPNNAVLTPQAQSDILSKAISNTIESQVNEAMKIVKKEVVRGVISGRDEMIQENMRRAGGGGGGGGAGGGAGGGGMLPGDAPPEIKAMLDAIAGAEGDWDSVNPSTSVTGLSNMTIAEARLAAIRKGIGEKGGSGAMGKFQQMPDYILERAKDAGLDPYKDKFNQENQTKIARMLMASVYPGGEAQLLKDLRSDPLKASSNLRGTWPSLPGGTQENVHTSGFLDRFNKNLTTYQSGSNAEVKPGKSKFSTHLEAFWEFRNKEFGASKERRATSSGEYYQVRELGVYGSKGYEINPLADDTSYEIEEHKGAGHWENRAFDIPVPESSAEGDKVAGYWKNLGYDVIWRSEGHYDHVHVEVPADKAEEFFKVMKEENLEQDNKREYDVIIPLDHHSGNVPPKSLWPNASLGASGKEREAQTPTAEIIKKRLEAKGLKVKIMRPEDYRTEDSYNKDLVRYSQEGSVVSSIHYDAPRSGGGIGFLARLGKSPDQNDKDYANKIAPILQAMAREAGNSEQSYGGIDTAGNITMRLAGPATAALIELGAMEEQRKKYGERFWENPEFIKYLNEVADATASSVQQRKQKPVKRPVGATGVLNKKPVVWDGKKWVASNSPQGIAAKNASWEEHKRKSQEATRRSEKIQKERPWWDKFGFFGGAAAENARKEKERKEFEKKNPGATLYRKMAGGPIGNKYNDLQHYPSYASGGGPIFVKQTVYVKVPA